MLTSSIWLICIVSSVRHKWLPSLIPVPSKAIDRDEAVAAAVDYFNGVMSKEEAIAVVRIYFAG